MARPSRTLIHLEMLLGALAFVTVVLAIWAVVKIVSGHPSVLVSVLLLVAVGCDALVYRAWKAQGRKDGRG